MDRVVVGLGFLEDESLLIVLEFGTYIIYNPYSGHSRFETLEPNHEFKDDLILTAKIFGDSFIYMTRKFNFYLIENVRRHTKSKIFAPSQGMDIDEVAANFSVSPPSDSERDNFEVYIPAKAGVIKAT